MFKIKIFDNIDLKFQKIFKKCIVGFINMLETVEFLTFPREPYGFAAGKLDCSILISIF